jgi:NAD+ kinase
MAGLASPSWRSLARALSRRAASSRPVASSYGYWDAGQFQPRKAVILTKVSRYEFEKQRHEQLGEIELEAELTARGSDYATIRYHHNIHKTLELEVERELQAAGLETLTVKRGEYNDEVVAWADMVVTTGGDGTFLMASSKILNRKKPVIGFNTDPTRSEGHLCLPKHYSFNVKQAVDKIVSGNFRWFFRKRLRITLIGDAAKINQTPVELNLQQLQVP